MVKGIKKSSKTQGVHNSELAPLNQRVGGIDIGAASVYACIGFPDGHQEIREFLTFTADLMEMLVWFQQNDIQSVAMESTGVYWIPVYDILAEGNIHVVLANAYYLKTVPGRKTDVKDCQWIQQLHSYGLLKGSFRPNDEEVELRGYVRQRSRLFELAAQQVQLMHKALTQMNLQINHVISNITGVTGMKIIRAIVSGERNPIVLAKFRDIRCHKTELEIAKALEGNYRQEHLLALRHALEAYDFFHMHVFECEKAIEQILAKWQAEQVITTNDSQNVSQCLSKNGKMLRKKTEYAHGPYSFEAQNPLSAILGVNLLDIPGIDVNGAIKILAEIGRNMKKWETVKHFTSWLGLCPGNKISGGKILSSRTKPSANRAAQALRLAANTLYKSKTALGAYFRRMKARLGPSKAITAAAHKLARILYTMLKERKSFNEIGQEAYEEAYKEKRLRSLRKQASELGHKLVVCEA